MLVNCRLKDKHHTHTPPGWPCGPTLRLTVQGLKSKQIDDVDEEMWAEHVS